MNIFLTISFDDGYLLTILFPKAFGNEEWYFCDDILVYGIDFSGKR
jgi:hypothetical protein